MFVYSRGAIVTAAGDLVAAEESVGSASNLDLEVASAVQTAAADSEEVVFRREYHYTF